MRRSIGIASVNPGAEEYLLQVGIGRRVVRLNAVHGNRRSLLKVAQDVAQGLLLEDSVRADLQ